MLWKHYEETVKWRVMYLAWTRKGDAAHTVLVTDIPGTASGTIIGRLNDVRGPHPVLDCMDVVLLQRRAVITKHQITLHLIRDATVIPNYLPQPFVVRNYLPQSEHPPGCGAGLRVLGTALPGWHPTPCA